MKKLLSAVLAAVLLSAPALPVHADGPSKKEEAVYGLLNYDGSVKNVYVVNIFDGGNITDYGDYSEVKNLSSSEKINRSADKITVFAAADRFYYQGTLISKELPWNIKITYSLDGKKINAAELAGKSGKLQIDISVSGNGSADESFFKNYALQITLALNNGLCKDISAAGATAAEAGGNKQLVYTVLPGKDASFSVTADVHDFEMDAVTVNGIKMALDIDFDKDVFTEQFVQLTDAIAQLDGGAQELLDGANRLSDGMNSYMDGLKTFNSGIAEFFNGIDGLYGGAASLASGLSKLTQQNDALAGGAYALCQAAFDTANGSLAASGFPVPNLTMDNYAEILANIPGLESLKAQLDGAVQFAKGIKSYTDGVAQLGTGASIMLDGAYRLKTSSAVLSEAANGIFKAGEEINTALKKLRDGLVSYKSGTEELKNGTSDIDIQIGDKIDEIIGNMTGRGETVSFVSEKNANVSAVQFALKTDAIEISQSVKDETARPVTLNFWQKLLKLFGLYK